MVTEPYHASCHFYTWEYRYRGYYHFPFRVNIEPPYTHFEHVPARSQVLDDGLVPSFFERLKAFISPPRIEVEEVQEEDRSDLPTPWESSDDVEVIILSFAQRQNIDVRLSVELLNMLACVRDRISFEIIGTSADITVQLTCSVHDYPRVHSHIKAYLPEALLGRGEQYDLPFDPKGSEIAVVDFGLEYEFMLPITVARDFKIDPLTSLIASFDSLGQGSVAVYQIIFQGVSNPLSKDIIHAVSDGRGGSFFDDNGEILRGAEDKVASQLFSCVVRVGTQGTSKNHSGYLAKQLIASITAQSDSGLNRLIALSNEGYNYDAHVMNIFKRKSNRFGMILNSQELVSLVHHPNNTVVSSKLGYDARVTKQAPAIVLGQRYKLGTNIHNSVESVVSLSDEQRLSHTHVIGVTGTGKSTLLAQMFLEDVALGNGGVMFDPHGDIVDDILYRIPDSRKGDVILLDPADTDFPVGFNLLQAETEAEKIVLSSDLVSAFQKYATSWGDRMTSVLANAIDTFLDSDTGGTLIELKRFLLEKKFRESFLKTVHDPQLHYYWNHDYTLVSRSSISPLLIRIDTFLRPKIIRMMMAQKEGLDVRDVVMNNKILLVKLSQGLIGKENSYLLGTLLVSKLAQVGLARQAIPKDERTPFYAYIDECHALLTESIGEMLSGVRKYGVGLILSHQDIKQLDDDKKLASLILSSPNIQICFRLGSGDAKVLESGFSGFTAQAFQSLERGQTIMRVGGAGNDFNMETQVLDSVSDSVKEVKDHIINNTREQYARPKSEVEQVLLSLLPSSTTEVKTERKQNKVRADQAEVKHAEPEQELEVVSKPDPITNDIDLEQEEARHKEKAKEERILREHEYLKNYVGKLAQEHGFRVVQEEVTESGGRVDVGIHTKDISIACEISCTNTRDYEVQNIQKCLAAGYTHVFMISKNEKHLESIREKALDCIEAKHHDHISFFHPDKFLNHLRPYVPKPKAREKIINGYRVRVNFTETSITDMRKAEETIAKTVFERMKKQGDQD